MATLTGTRMTADEFLATEESEGYELVHGCPEEIPVGTLSAWVGGKLFGRLDRFLEEHPIGTALPQETPVKAWPADPDHFRKPDGMFVSKLRLPSIPVGTLEVAPDLVFEVVSPRDEALKMEVKLKEYFAAGVRLIWVIYPETRSVYIYRADGGGAWLGPDGMLTGEDVLPGFSVAVKDLFPSS